MNIKLRKAKLSDIKILDDFQQGIAIHERPLDKTIKRKGRVRYYHLKEFRSFDDARKFVRKLKLKSKTEWEIYRQSGIMPEDIPSNPNATYKNKGWSSWGDFLGTGTLSTQDISQNWLPWKEAKLLYQKIAKENNITTKKQWQHYIKTHKLPKGLSAYPEKTYTEKRSRKIVK